MTRDQNAGQSHNMKIYNGSFEKVEMFKYLGTNITYQITIQKKVKVVCNQGMLLLFGAESFVFWWGTLRKRYTWETEA